jgi:hypothetical protein
MITHMCVTWRHDYWVTKEESGFGSGMTLEERESLWNRMAQIFDNDIAPYMQFKENRPRPKLVRDGIIKVHSFEFTEKEKQRMNLALRYGPESAYMKDDGTLCEQYETEDKTIIQKILNFLGF